MKRLTSNALYTLIQLLGTEMRAVIAQGGGDGDAMLEYSSTEIELREIYNELDAEQIAEGYEPMADFDELLGVGE